jgi:hypothetical protein
VHMDRFSRLYHRIGAHKYERALCKLTRIPLELA